MKLSVTAAGRVYGNIRRFCSTGCPVAALRSRSCWPGPALPLLPAQILWVNLLTHGLPGVARGGEPANPGVMSRPPRPPAESVLGAGLWRRIIGVGLVVATVTLGVALWATPPAGPGRAFFALGTTQLAVALGSRARPGSLANPMLLAAVGGALALQFAVLYLPFRQELLHTQPLTGLDLLAAARSHTATTSSTSLYAAGASSARPRTEAARTAMPAAASSARTILPRVARDASFRLSFRPAPWQAEKNALPLLTPERM